ncbi:MAG: YdeI/OmpD-associated family protein [Raineya sp.]|jgi:hypothetical protein|nr:YdeI/OmpD-associated family protein [Raineya sp.]
MEEKPLVDKEVVLRKFQGKGGWTYAEIPEVLQNKHTPFGWVRVRGFIDDYEIKSYHLMPMGNGRLFLPVKAQIRKIIKKQEGDTIWVKLYADNAPTEIPEEFKECLVLEPNAYESFLSCSDNEQKAFIEWVYSAKTDKTKVERISKVIEMVLKNEKLHKSN